MSWGNGDVDQELSEEVCEVPAEGGAPHQAILITKELLDKYGSSATDFKGEALTFKVRIPCWWCSSCSNISYGMVRIMVSGALHVVT